MASAANFEGSDSKTAAEVAAGVGEQDAQQGVSSTPSAKRAKVEEGPKKDATVTLPEASKTPQTVRELCAVLRVQEKLAQAFLIDLGGDSESSLDTLANVDEDDIKETLASLMFQDKRANPMQKGGPSQTLEGVLHGA